MLPAVKFVQHKVSTIFSSKRRQDADSDDSPEPRSPDPSEEASGRHEPLEFSHPNIDSPSHNTHAAPQDKLAQRPVHDKEDDGIIDSSSTNTTVPQNILAFRSITTMLSSLRRSGEMNVTHTDKTSLDSRVRQELRILVALACVLVRNHEVITVVALRPREGEHIQTIACSVNDDKERPKLPQIGNDETPKHPFWSLFATGNHRRDNDPSNGSLGVRNQHAPVIPRVDLDIYSKFDPSSFRQSYITRDAYVQFKTFVLEPFTYLV